MRNPVIVPQGEVELSLMACDRLHAEISGQGLKYHIESYGCQMNDHDSEKLAGMLQRAGFTKAKDKFDANLLLFNTCCVREHAEKRVFGNIGALKKRKDEVPNLLIGVCGCMMQQEGMAERLAKRFPFVDMVFGTHELHNFPVFLERAYNGERVVSAADMDGLIAEGVPIARNNGAFASVNIIYGCDNFCTYCIVPYVRGRERSRTAQSILEEVQALAQSGVKEVMLLGQNVNSYKNGEIGFAQLLAMVNDIEGIERIRFMTSHPKDLSEDLIDAMATLPKVCRHLHLPVQSGSNAVLAAMNRQYTREQYLRLVESLRSRVPGLELTTDIIVGFPGETEADFADTLSLLHQADFSAAYTFKYSARTGTKAATMADQVPEEVKKRRLQELNEAVAALVQKGNEKYVGQSGKVLVEGCDRREVPMAFGKLSNLKMVYFPGDERLIGNLCEVRITATQNNSLIGEMIATKV